MSETVSSVAAGREFLAIPGPTVIPDAVLQAMHRPAMDIYAGPMVDLTDTLLRRRADVLAFASARPAQGGTGATIVLLQRA